jgi:hypothetical protein
MMFDKILVYPNIKAKLYYILYYTFDLLNTILLLSRTFVKETTHTGLALKKKKKKKLTGPNLLNYENLLRIFIK